MDNTTEFRNYIEKTIKVYEKNIEEMKAILSKMDGTAPTPKKTRAKKTSDGETSPKEKAPKKKAETTPLNIMRIPRVLKALKMKLDAEASRMGVDTNDELYATYRSYINEMPDEEYAKHENKDDHMVDFMKLNVKGSSNAAGGGPAPLLVKKVSELKNLKETEIGIFQEKSGKLVTGPAEDEDEDMEDTTFNGEAYVLGTKTGRVYKVDPSGGPDTFCGFWGVGKFADAAK